jgi:site-specific DNA-cytosine methylase
VRMKKVHDQVITDILGVQPVLINSALVSAQNRRRLYWTNIYEGISQPIDQHIYLKDILQDDVDEKYNLSEAALSRILRKTAFTPQIEPEKTGTLNTKNNSGQLSVDSGTTLIKCLNPRTADNVQTQQQNRIYEVGNTKFPAITSSLHGRNNIAVTKKGYIKVLPGQCFDAENLSSITLRGRLMAEKSNCLMAKTTDFIYYNLDYTFRRLTEIECERLQTVPDNYTEGVSSTQRYRMLGNG